MEEYKAVSCNLYDLLSNAVVLQQQTTIFTTEHETYTGQIKDLFTQEKSEFCVINDKILRLDKIAKLIITDKKGEESTSLWSNPNH